MLDMEFYVGVLNQPEGKSLPVKYMDPNPELLQTIDSSVFMDSGADFTMERNTLICTPPPNLSKWAMAAIGQNPKVSDIFEQCMVKVYDEIMDQFKLCQNCEFVGVLTSP